MRTVRIVIAKPMSAGKVPDWVAGRLRIIQLTILFILHLTCAMSAGDAKTVDAEPRVPTPARRMLVEGEVLSLVAKFDSGFFGVDDQRQAKRLLAKARGIDRSWLVACLAGYERAMRNQPFEGLRLLAPEIFDADTAARFAKSLAQNRLTHATDTVKPVAVPSLTAVSGVVKFPVDAMKIEPVKAPCALEAARCLMDAGLVDEGLAVIDRFGRRFEGEDRVLSFECLGDLDMKARLLEKAVAAYESGVGLLASIKSASLTDEWRKELDERLRTKFAKARRLLDADRYGAGFVAYREAETARRVDKSFIEAVPLYDALLIEFPETVYAEAAKCYRNASLLELARLDGPGAKEHAAISKAEAVFEKAKKRIEVARLAKVPEEALGELKAAATTAEGRVCKLRSAFYGAKALASAEVAVEAAFEEAPYGLYRGEMLLDMADYQLESALDENAAERLYRRAADWFDKVKDIDNTLRLYEIPGQAKAVAAPPPKRREVDALGNILEAPHPVGDVFNRRSCDWYGSRMRERAALRLGLLACHRSDFVAARREWGALPRIDPFYAWCEDQRRGSAFNRLLWNLDHNGGCLYATPAEMKAFKNPGRRLVTLVADLSYECEEREKALAAYNELLDGRHGELTRMEQAYLLYAKSACLAWVGKPGEDVQFMKSHLDDFRGTPTDPRALLGLANRMAAQPPGGAGRGEAFHYLELLRKRHPDSPEAVNALFVTGLTQWIAGDRGKAVKAFKDYLKADDGGGRAKAAHAFIAEFEAGKSAAAPAGG